jgi:hypothetical protein
MQISITERFQRNTPTMPKVRSLLQNPLTFVILVWGLLIFVAGLYFAYA